jgi:hypothetical protein
MPLKKAKGRSKKEVNKAVSQNMHQLSKDNKSKPRSLQQRLAIAISAAKGK